MLEKKLNAKLDEQALIEAERLLESVREVRSHFSSERLSELSSETNGRLSLIGAQIVVALSVQPSQSAAELSRMLSVAREGCSAAISTLRGNGLVEIDYDSAAHVGNHYAIRLTEPGVEAARKLVR